MDSEERAEFFRISPFPYVADQKDSLSRFGVEFDEGSVKGSWWMQGSGKVIEP